MIEQYENYNKRSLRNKTLINTMKGPLRLSVPLKKGKHERAPIKSVRIAYDEPWQKIHWQSIQSAYGRAPFFEHYEQEIKAALLKRHEFLFDMNLEIIELIRQLLQWPYSYDLTHDYYKKSMDQLHIFRDVIGVHGALNQAEEQLNTCIRSYESNGENLELVRMSILDLLFCTGPESSLLLQKFIPSNG